MQTNILSTFANCIASVQLKLSDCFSRNPSLKEGITSRLSENKRRNLNVPTELVIRWDNAPHHRQIKTFPHHKHIKDAILESKEVTIKEVLEELEKMIK